MALGKVKKRSPSSATVTKLAEQQKVLALRAQVKENLEDARRLTGQS